MRAKFFENKLQEDSLSSKIFPPRMNICEKPIQSFRYKNHKDYEENRIATGKELI